MAKASEVQQALFTQIKSLSDQKLVDVISESLNVSSDAAYRRIRNEKPLTIDEVIVLCKQFNLSIDNHIGLVSKTKIVPFSFPFDSLEFDFKTYLTSIYQNMAAVRQAGGTVYFSAKDLPMFHCFQLKNLTKFKLFYWQKTMLSRRKLVGVKYDDFKIDDEHYEICANIYDAYANVNSVEIWNYETIHGLISQISYYKTLGFISEDMMNILFDEVKRILEHLLYESELEHKCHINKKGIANTNNFKLFFNEVLAADNSIYAEFGEHKAAFMPSIILNYITSTDHDYCNYIKSVFESVMKKSTLISGVNEKDRSLFFNYNFDRLSSERKK